MIEEERRRTMRFTSPTRVRLPTQILRRQRPSPGPSPGPADGRTGVALLNWHNFMGA